MLAVFQLRKAPSFLELGVSKDTLWKPLYSGVRWYNPTLFACAFSWGSTDKTKPFFHCYRQKATPNLYIQKNTYDAFPIHSYLSLHHPPKIPVFCLTKILHRLEIHFLAKVGQTTHQINTSVLKDWKTLSWVCVWPLFWKRCSGGGCCWLLVVFGCHFSFPELEVYQFTLQGTNDQNMGPWDPPKGARW